MEGFYLKFYMYENRKHHGKLLYEWLLEKAKEIGIHGGSVFRAIAGFGRHGILHEEHFFDLASNVPVEAIFIVNDEEYKKIIDMIKDEKLNIMYVKSPVEYGVINGVIDG